MSLFCEGFASLGYIVNEIEFHWLLCGFQHDAACPFLPPSAFRALLHPPIPVPGMFLSFRSI